MIQQNFDRDMPVSLRTPMVWLPCTCVKYVHCGCVMCPCSLWQLSWKIMNVKCWCSMARSTSTLQYVFLACGVHTPVPRTLVHMMGPWCYRTCRHEISPWIRGFPQFPEDNKKQKPWSTCEHAWLPTKLRLWYACLLTPMIWLPWPFCEIQSTLPKSNLLGLKK